MSHTFPLNLEFRGERTYLHGTDTYESITKCLPENFSNDAISITFHAQMRRQPDLIFDIEEPRHWRDNPDFRGEVRIGAGAEAKHGILMESSREVTGRKSCNEKIITAFAVIHEESRQASLGQTEEGNSIEQVVFLNKKLHQVVLPNLGSQWLFARLELSNRLPPPLSGHFTLKLTQVLGGRFTRSDILWDGQRLGAIFFSLAT